MLTNILCAFMKPYPLINKAQIRMYYMKMLLAMFSRDTNFTCGFVGSYSVGVRLVLACFVWILQVIFCRVGRNLRVVQGCDLFQSILLRFDWSAIFHVPFNIKWRVYVRHVVLICMFWRETLHLKYNNKKNWEWDWTHR